MQNGWDDLSSGDLEPARRSLLGSIIDGAKSLFTRNAGSAKTSVGQTQANQNVISATALYEPRHQNVKKEEHAVIPARLYLAFENAQRGQQMQRNEAFTRFGELRETLQALREENKRLQEKAEQMRTDYIRLAKNTDVVVMKLPTRKEEVKQSVSEPAKPQAVLPTSAASNQSISTTMPEASKESKPAFTFDKPKEAEAPQKEAPKFNFSMASAAAPKPAAAAPAEAPVAATAPAAPAATAAPKFTFGNAAAPETQTSDKPKAFSFAAAEKEAPKFQIPESKPEQKPTFTFKGAENPIATFQKPGEQGEKPFRIAEEPAKKDFAGAAPSAEKTEAPRTTFSFGATAAAPTVAAAPVATTQPAAAAAPKPTFSFAAPPAPVADSAKPAFVFGAPSGDKPAFTFAAGGTSNTTFNFGAGRKQ